MLELQQSQLMQQIAATPNTTAEQQATAMQLDQVQKEYLLQLQLQQ